MAQASGYSSDLTPSLGTSICHRCSPQKTKKEKRKKLKTIVSTLPMLTQKHILKRPFIFQNKNTIFFFWPVLMAFRSSQARDWICITAVTPKQKYLVRRVTLVEKFANLLIEGNWILISISAPVCCNMLFWLKYMRKPGLTQISVEKGRILYVILQPLELTMHILLWFYTKTQQG